MIENPFIAKGKFVNVNAKQQLQGIIIVHCMHFKISILSSNCYMAIYEIMFNVDSKQALQCVVVFLCI